MATIDINGEIYLIKRNRKHGRYVEIQIENVTEGMVLDMGTFAGRDEAMYHGAINPNTWSIRLANGQRYTETRGAKVRVWIDEA